MRSGEKLTVTGGRWKKARLFAGPSGKIRATTQLVRASVFNILQERVEGARFLDLFSGTGAVGIEALSRGAKSVVFVESHTLNAAVIRRNLEKFHASARIITRPVSTALSLMDVEGEPFDVIFLDPPYDEPFHCAATMEYLAESRLIAPNSVVIVQAHKSVWLRERYGPLVLRKRYKYGTTHLWVYDYPEDRSESGEQEATEEG